MPAHDIIIIYAIIFFSVVFKPVNGEIDTGEFKYLIGERVA